MRVFFGHWAVQGWLVVLFAVCAAVPVGAAIVSPTDLRIFGFAAFALGWAVVFAARLSVVGVRGRLVGWMPRCAIDAGRVDGFRVVDAFSAAARIVAVIGEAEVTVLAAPCPWYVNADRHRAALLRTSERMMRWCEKATRSR